MLVAMQSSPTIMKISMEDPQKNYMYIYVKLYVSVSVVSTTQLSYYTAGTSEGLQINVSQR